MMRDGSNTPPIDQAPNNLNQTDSSYLPPRLVDPLIERKQLIQSLDLLESRAVLFLGAAGSGKTFALTSLYRHLAVTGRRCDWISLTSVDDDPSALAEKLAAGISPQSIPLMIDGGERIRSENAWAILEQAVLKYSENRPVMLTTQTMRRSALYDGWLRGTVEVVGPDSLHMCNEEAGELFGASYSDSEIDALTRFVQGWPAGLRLLSRAPETARALANALPGNGIPLPMALSRYIEDVVLPRLSDQALETLTSLAALERFTPKMLPAMPEPRCDWQSVQALLHDGNYLRPLDQTLAWIGVNGAIGQHLRARQRHKAPHRYEELKHFAAKWFADHGLAAEAVRHAGQMADAKGAAEIIEQAGAINVELGAGPDIDLSIDLPPQRARDLPLLFFSQVYHRIRHGRHLQARMAYDKACELTENFTQTAPSVDANLIAAWAHLFNIVFASIDDQAIPAQDIELAVAFMQACVETHPVLAASLASVIVWAYIENGELEKANRIAQMGFDPRDGAIRVTLFLHVHWVNLLLMYETVDRAIHHIEQAQTLARIECGADSYEVLIPQLKRGILHYEQDQLLEARACLSPALARLRTINGWVRIYAETLTTAVAVELGLGQTDRAEAQLRVGEQFALTRELPRLCAILAAQRAELDITNGDLRAARDRLEAEPLAQLLASNATDAYTLLAKAPAILANARLMLELNRPRDTLTVLEGMAQVFACNPDTRLRFTHHVYAMRASFELRRYNSAVEHMLTALEIASTTGLIRRVREQQAPIVSIYDWAVRNGKNVPQRLRDFVERVLTTTCPAKEQEQNGRARSASSFGTLTLSPREAEIITLVAEGLSAKEIALRLGISEGTVKSHRKKIHGKLGVSTRSQAILKAKELLII